MPPGSETAEWETPVGSVLGTARGRWIGKAARALGVFAFALVLLPCIFRLSTREASFFDALVFGGFGLAVQTGLVLGGIALALVGATATPRRMLSTTVVALGAAACVLGSLSAVLSMFLDVPAPAMSVAGFFFGVGLNVVVLAWSICSNSTDLRILLTGCSTACLAAVVTINLLTLLPAGLTGAIYLLCVVLACTPPLAAALTDGLRFPQYSADADHGIEDDLFAKRISLADFAFVLSTSTVGLMLFAALSNARLFEVTPSGPSSTSLGMAASAVIITIAVQVRHEEPIVPFVYWVLCPAVAGILTILDAFPLDSTPFQVGAAGASFFFSAVGIFAVALLLAVSHRAKFSPLVTVGVSVALLAVATSAGRLLIASGMDYTERGPFLLVASTGYFVYLLIAPAVQLWKLRRNDMHGETMGPTNDDHVRRACDSLAERFKLSHRENEILYYASRGYNSSYTARALFVSDSTVRSHLKNIYRKMGITSKMEIIEFIENADHGLAMAPVHEEAGQTIRAGR